MTRKTNPTLPTLFGLIAGVALSLTGAHMATAQGTQATVLKHTNDIPFQRCQPGNLCAIQLQPGEVVTEALALGNPVHWSAELRVAGEADRQMTRVVVMPDEAATETSLMIATNRGFYDIRLVPSETDPMSVIGFTDAPPPTAENNLSWGHAPGESGIADQ